MTRSRIEFLLEDYVCGDLDAAGRREVEALIERDPALRERLAEMHEAHDALSCLRERPEPRVSAQDVLPQIQAAIAAQSFERRPKLYLESSSTRFYRRIAAAAVLTLAVGGGLWFANSGSAGATPPTTELDGANGGPALLDARPSAAERGLERFIDAARHGPIDGEQLRRLMEGRDPSRFSIVPRSNALPVVAGATESRYR